jgi:uncharacterized repeat protein (TIGR03803 family)
LPHRKNLEEVMNKTIRRLKLCILAIGLLAPTANAGVLFTNIFTFNGTNGDLPDFLVPAGNNKFYGSTEDGGPDWDPSNHNYDLGGIFSITYDGVFSNLFFFDGTDGTGGQYLTSGIDGNFYGLAFGDYVFKLNPDGTMANPNLLPNINGDPGFFVQDRDGTIYGTIETQFFAPPGYGTIYKIDTNGVASTLVNFNGTNGCSPVCLLLGADNNFYGVAESGGNGFTGPDAGGYGTIFRVDRNGNLTNIFFFSDSNSTPVTMVQGADGDLYGSTAYGGINNAGTLFRMSTNGDLVWSFPLNGTNAYGSAWLITVNDGNIYGITHWGGSTYTYLGPNYIGGGNGVIFRMTPGGSFTTLFEFDGTNDIGPHTMTQGTDGNFYGTAENDGGLGNGVIFKLSIPMQPSFTAITQSNGLISLKWTSVSGQMYQLQTNSSLCSTDWGNLGAPILATNGFMCASDTVAPNASLFYRVTVLP